MVSSLVAITNQRDLLYNSRSIHPLSSSSSFLIQQRALRDEDDVPRVQHATDPEQEDPQQNCGGEVRVVERKIKWREEVGTVDEQMDVHAALQQHRDGRQEDGDDQQEQIG